jgi:hypothetical protein
MSHRKSGVACVLTPCFLALLLTYTPSASAGGATQSLRGIQGVYISVDDLDHEVEKDGLSSQQLRMETAEQVQKAGIRVFSREEWFNTIGAPSLSINLHVLKLEETKEYIYSIHIGLKQDVYLVREPIPASGATTWSLGTVTGITYDLEKIRTSLRDRIAHFITDFFSVNKPTGSTP